jgi:hypothetical protein
MMLFWIFLILVIIIVAGNALILLRTARPSGSKPPQNDPKS